MAGAVVRRGRSKAFPVTIALVSLCYNIFVATVAQYLPDDPLYIGTSIAAYAWSGSVLSVLGLAGILWNKPALVASLAHFLLLDTFMSALSRMLALELFLDSISARDLCNDHPQPPAAAAPGWQHSRTPYFDVVSSVHWQRRVMRQSPRSRRCHYALGMMQVVFMGMLLCVTAAQGMLALAMRRHSRDMENAASSQPPDRFEHVKDEKMKLQRA